MTNSEAYLVGYWLGDGSITRVQGQVQLCGNQHDLPRVSLGAHGSEMEALSAVRG